ncbi:MAG TPA: hypothetical protein VFZ73_04280 [Gemmatimonadaceae bacterium]
MSRFLASLSSVLSWITFVGGASYMLFVTWEILRPRFPDTTLVAAAVLLPITLLVTPVYAVMELGDWRLAVTLVVTVVLTAMLRLAKRNFERA